MGTTIRSLKSELVRIIGERDRAERALAREWQKISHGCSDGRCDECDNWIPNAQARLNVREALVRMEKNKND
jgi:hypothetical protein